jgi:HK97 family phage portal protein
MNLGKIGQSISKFFIGVQRYGSVVWDWILPGEWSKTELLKKYNRVVYPIVSTIAENAAKVELTVERQLQTTVSPQLNHEFLKLLKRPNPMMSQFQFLELHFTFMKLCGESYWYLLNGEQDKKPKQLYLLRPDLMKVVVDTTDNPLGLVTGYALNKLDGKSIPFETSEILHFKLPNPIDPYYGYGPVQAAKIFIETEGYTSKWTRNSIYNSGRPSGVLGLKSTMESGQFDKLKRQFKQEYSGIKNAGRTLLLKGIEGMSYQKLGMDLDGIALKELKDMSRDDIMLVFRASKTMLGITDDVNRASSQDQREVFIQNLIKPELDRFVDHVNAFLMNRWNATDVLKYKDPSTQTDEQKIAMWTAGHNKWLTTNEIRAEQNRKPLPGGDVIREPINLIPSTGPVKESLKKKAIKHKGYDPIRVNVFKQLFFDNQGLWEKRYKEFMQEEFKKQEKEILSKNKSKTSFTNWHFDATGSKGRIMATLVPYGFELMAEAAKFALDLADDGDTIFQINQKIQEFIHDRIEKLATETNDFTISEIEQTIAQGVTDGESVAKLRERIRNVYDNADKVRAERIARTETLAASNAGANEAYRQSPMVAYKEWSAEADACDFCLALDGKIVGLEDDFAKAGENIAGDDEKDLHVSYEDIGFPPLHPNCKCAILPVAQ